ncbi:hypothetical protein F4604DRAFT_245304 [Suillus subluteus]|nr:hypothetical protein F4604DRAFT_245304 [Suillus subluteus]
MTSNTLPELSEFRENGLITKTEWVMDFIVGRSDFQTPLAALGHVNVVFEFTAKLRVSSCPNSLCTSRNSGGHLTRLACGQHTRLKQNQITQLIISVSHHSEIMNCSETQQISDIHSSRMLDFLSDYAIIVESRRSPDSSLSPFRYVLESAVGALSIT